MAAVCIQLENPFTMLLVNSTVFIPTWFLHALVAIFLLSNVNITIKPSSFSNSNPRYREPAIFLPSQLSSDAPHSLADVARYWLAVLFSALSSVYPARSNQSRFDFQPSGVRPRASAALNDAGTGPRPPFIGIHPGLYR
jgi:hypothetical protein